MPDRKDWAALSPALSGVPWLAVVFFVGCGATADLESCSSRTRETCSVVRLWWFKLGKGMQGCGRSCWIAAQQESPESKGVRSMWGSWLAAHPGGDVSVGIWGTPVLGMMGHWSAMPKLSLTRAILGNGTNPCHAISAWQEFTGSSGVNQGVEEVLKLGMCTASKSLGRVLGSRQHPLLISGHDLHLHVSTVASKISLVTQQVPWSQQPFPQNASV